MKLLRSLTCLMITLQFAMAQCVTVQGVIRDNDKNTIPDGEYTITFKLYSTESDGSSSWTEEQTLTVINGVYGAELGTVESLTSLDWDTQYWLEIASISGADFSTPVGEALSPRTRMTMTPYAIMAGMNGTTNVIPQDGDVQFGSSLNVDGNVGIGTTSPSFKLDVQPNSAGARIGGAEVGAWPANSAYAYFGNQDLDHATSGNYALLQHPNGMTFLNATSGQSLRFRINNSDKMILASNGNVGIGTTSPAQKLHVNGSARITGDLDTDGDIKANNVNARQEVFRLTTGHQYLNTTVWTNLNGASGTATVNGSFCYSLQTDGMWVDDSHHRIYLRLKFQQGGNTYYAPNSNEEPHMKFYYIDHTRLDAWNNTSCVNDIPEGTYTVTLQWKGENNHNTRWNSTYGYATLSIW